MHGTDDELMADTAPDLYHTRELEPLMQEPVGPLSL